MALFEKLSLYWEYPFVRYALVEQLHSEGIAVIMITHDVSAALKYADHILRLGEDCFFGTKEEYLKSGVNEHGAV